MKSGTAKKRKPTRVRGDAVSAFVLADIGKARRFTVICIRNNGYPASLEPHKVYQAVSDEGAARRGLIRVVDESGEDYLYPAEYFMPVDLPVPVKRALQLTG